MVRQREPVGGSRQHRHLHRRLGSRLGGESAKVGLWFHGHHARDGLRVVGKVQAVPSADLDHLPGQSGEQLPTEVAHPLVFHPYADPGV